MFWSISFLWFIEGTYLELADGPLMQTGNPMDIAVAGDGWLSFQLPGGETGYSRHGRLVVKNHA